MNPEPTLGVHGAASNEPAGNSAFLEIGFSGLSGSHWFGGDSSKRTDFQVPLKRARQICSHICTVIRDNVRSVFLLSLLRGFYLLYLGGAVLDSRPPPASSFFSEF